MIDQESYPCVLFNLELGDIEPDDPSPYVGAEEFLRALRDSER